MIDKIEITVDVIVHATEDISKFFQSFEKILKLKEENFTVEESLGHYENPIVMLNVKIVKNRLKILYINCLNHYPLNKPTT